MTESPIRVLIADDQRVVREGLIMLVSLIDGVEVVGTASDGAEAVERAVSARPDVVLMDLRMPAMEGAEATDGSAPPFPKRRCSCSPPTPTTNHSSPPFRRARADT